MENQQEQASDSPSPQDSRKAGLGKLWTLVNSPFLLLILSSLVLTGISQRYALYQSEAAERIARRSTFFKLLTELEYRITRLEIDESELLSLEPGDAADMRRLGHDALTIVTGEAPRSTSMPEFRNVYLGAIINQLELTAGLQANRELGPVTEALVIDDCETATALHGELNVLRHWIELRHSLVDDQKLPKIPTEILSAADQASLVMPDFDVLRARNTEPGQAQARRLLTSLQPVCEDAGRGD